MRRNSLDHTASELFGHQPTKLDRTRVGDRLRYGLDELADRWVPESKKQPMRTWRPRESTPRASLESARGTVLVTPAPSHMHRHAVSNIRWVNLRIRKMVLFC
jgi:hypothetical protein